MGIDQILRLRSELEIAAWDQQIAGVGRLDLRNLGQKIANWVTHNG